MAHLAAQKWTCVQSRPQRQVAFTATPPVQPRCGSVQAARAAGPSSTAEQGARRDVLLAFGAASALGLVPAQQAWAEDAPAPSEYTTFLGYATPPTSYGGYGGNAKEAPRYTFEYPSNWKPDQPNKVEKGTQGIDGRVVNPRGKDQRAFVITLTRAGEDNASFKLADIDSTLSGFAGADYDLQDALSGSTNKSATTRQLQGATFYDYEIESPDYHYLASVTVSQGKIFALFVRSPAKTFGPNAEKLRHVISTFKLL